MQIIDYVCIYKITDVYANCIIPVSKMTNLFLKILQMFVFSNFNYRKLHPVEWYPKAV